MFTVQAGLFLASMKRKNLLWLCSWYPDKNEPFNGDFVQRHAVAAALFNDVFVIHVAIDSEEKSHVNTGIKIPGLEENIVYFKPTSGWMTRWRNYNRWSKGYKKTIREHIRMHGKPDLVHVHVPMRDGIMAMKLKRLFGIPYIVTEHWTLYQPQNIKSYQEQPTFLKSLIYWILRKSSLLLPVSDDLGKLMNKLVTPKKYVVVENVANTDFFYFSDRHQKANSFRFLHVSNFNYQKNAEGIIDSFILLVKKIPTAELVLVGNIPTEFRERLLASGLVNKNIILTGEISYPEVAKQMQAADALVLFSRFENSPCSIIESLCCGLPVIATRVGGIPELIDNSNGLLVESMDNEALLNAMEAMIKNYLSFDQASISLKAMARFSYPVIGKKLDEVYEMVMKEKN